MARKNSTTAPAGTRIHQWSDSRPMPSTAPSGSAMAMDRPAAISVSWRPGSRKVVHTLASVKNGSHWDHSSSPLSWSVEITHQAPRASTARKPMAYQTFRRLARGPGAS